MPPVYAMQWPEFPVVLGWLAATLGGLILSCAITMLLNISLFWSVSGEGIVRIVPMLINLLSGNIIPLPLFPDWLQPVLRYQPFSGVLDGPAQIFCGTMGMDPAARPAAYPGALERSFDPAGAPPHPGAASGA